MSVENLEISSNLGTEKISRTPESPLNQCCVKQQKSFPTYHLDEWAASRPGGQVPEMHWFSRAKARIAMLPWLRVTRYRKQFTYERRNE